MLGMVNLPIWKFFQSCTQKGECYCDPSKNSRDRVHLPIPDNCRGIHCHIDADVATKCRQIPSWNLHECCELFCINYCHVDGFDYAKAVLIDFFDGKNSICCSVVCLQSDTILHHRTSGGNCSFLCVYFASSKQGGCKMKLKSLWRFILNFFKKVPLRHRQKIKRS